MRGPANDSSSAEATSGPANSSGHALHAKSVPAKNFGINCPDPSINVLQEIKLAHFRSRTILNPSIPESDVSSARQLLKRHCLSSEENERGDFKCSDSGELTPKRENETTSVSKFILLNGSHKCDVVSSYANQKEFSNKFVSNKSKECNSLFSGEHNRYFSKYLGSSDTSKKYSCRKPVKKMEGSVSPRPSCHSSENNLGRGSECASEFSTLESTDGYQKSFRRRNGALERPLQRRTASDFSSAKTRSSAHKTGSFGARLSGKMNGFSMAFTSLLLFIVLGLDNRIPGASATERPRYRTTFACEGSTLNMDCEPGHVINLIRANYGRFSITICNEHGNTEWSVNCMSRRSHRVLHDKCSQRQNCSVAASTRGFGDPCPGTLKYLEAQFQCVPVNLPHGRPRPSWLMEAQSTVSSITGDQPLQRPPHGRDRANSPTEPGGLGPSDVDTFGGLPDGDTNDGILDSELLDPDGLGSSSSTSTTTTLRPPPWLKTNITKNSTTTTTTTSTTSTTTTTTPRPSTPNNTDSSSSSSVAPPLDDESNLPSRGRVEGAPATVPVSFPDSQAANSESDHALGEEDMRGRQDIFEDQDILLEEEMGHSFSHNYPQVPVGHDRVNENLPSPGWRPRESWCGPSSGRGLMWNWTRAGEKAVQACPGGASGWARRDCYTGGWAPRADLGECRSVWLSTLTSRAQGSDSVLAVVHDLSAVTAVRSLYGGDVTAAARLLTSLAKRMAMSLSHFPDTAQREALLTELLSTTLASASHLIGSQEDAWGDLQPNEHRAAVTTLLLGLEQAAFLLADNLRHQKVVVESYPNILMRLQVLETRNVANPVTFPSLDEVWQVPTPQPGPPSSASPSATPLEPAASSVILNPSSSSRAGSLPTPGHRARGIPAYDSITLPPEALLENSENRLIKMVFFSYQGLEKLLQPTFSYSLDPAFKMRNRTRLLNSRVVAASLGSGRHIELTEPVIITFALLTTQNVTNASCVFWDYTTSLWSEEGCRVVGSNVSHVSCQCDHLTNFAVLMDFHATPLSPEHTFALAVITYVGCIVSIVCLLLAIVVFQVFKGLQSDRTSIHKNLCACLLVAEILFLGGINQTGNRIACGVIAGLLHYFFLAAFAWMFMEGLQLYLLLVEVFEAERSRLKWYCLASYGAPAIVVVVSLGIDPLSYGTPQVCWLRTDNNFIFAFIGPVAVVLLANAVFLVLSLVVLCRHTSTSASLKNKEHTKLASVRTWLRGAFVLVFLLGLTWTFGLLYLNQQTVVMAYIFTVLNALQGLFIFIFHCIQNDKVKKEMRGACRRHAWLRACLCDYSHGLNTPSSSVVSKPDTRANSLRRHPSLSPSAVLASATHPAASVGNTSYNHHQNNASSASELDNQLQLQQQHQHHQQHFLRHSNVTNATLATDTLVTSANSSPLHHAHVANVVGTHHQLVNNLDHHHHHHHHHPFPKLSHGSNSSYSEQVLIERPNNFSVPTSPSLSSSQTSSSASELNTSFGGPLQDPNHAASYQNFLAFRAQQLNAAQIYASPPGTPMSQLYDTAGPCNAPSNCDVDSANLSMDPRFNIYQPCGTPESPHLYIQPQSYPRPPAHPQRSMHESQDKHNVAAVKVSTLNSNGVPRSMTTSVVRNNYLNLTPATSTSHSVPTSPEEEEISSKRANAHPLAQPVHHSRNLKTIPHSNTSRVIQNNQIKEQNSPKLMYINHGSSPASKFIPPNQDETEVLMC